MFISMLGLDRIDNLRPILNKLNLIKKDIMHLF